MRLFRRRRIRRVLVSDEAIRAMAARDRVHLTPAEIELMEESIAKLNRAFRLRKENEQLDL